MKNKTAFAILILVFIGCSSSTDVEKENKKSVIKAKRISVTVADTAAMVATYKQGAVGEQFHVAVEANPSNDGEVNPKWKNNYVVTYTTNNWETKTIVKGQVTYQGFDDNDVQYFTSIYEELSFGRSAAIDLAKQFISIGKVVKFEAYELLKHEKLKLEYNAESKKLCFGCNDHLYKNKKPKPIVIY